MSALGHKPSIATSLIQYGPSGIEVPGESQTVPLRLKQGRHQNTCPGSTRTPPVAAFQLPNNLTNT
jgi:hypothetical protein